MLDYKNQSILSLCSAFPRILFYFNANTDCKYSPDANTHRYARSVSANSQMTINAQADEPIVGTGDLTYRMVIGEGITLGGDTEITISPNHNISGISPM